MLVLRIRGLNKFRGESNVVRDLDLETREGELIAFLGPSGCATRTKLLMIAWLEGILDGEIKKLHQQVASTIVDVTHVQVEAMTLAGRGVVIRDGSIDQVGTPTEAFNHPANIFFAAFIGSPPRNQLPATLDDGWPRSAADRSIALPSRLREAVSAGQQIAPCVRLDDISSKCFDLQEAGEHETHELEVDIADPPGLETLVYSCLAGQKVLANLHGPRLASPGERLTCCTAPTRAHLFDAAPGRNLEAA